MKRLIALLALAAALVACTPSDNGGAASPDDGLMSPGLESPGLMSPEMSPDMVPSVLESPAAS